MRRHGHRLSPISAGGSLIAATGGSSPLLVWRGTMHVPEGTNERRAPYTRPRRVASAPCLAILLCAFAVCGPGCARFAAKPAPTLGQVSARTLTQRGGVTRNRGNRVMSQDVARDPGEETAQPRPGAQAVTEGTRRRTNQVAMRCAEGLHARSCAVRRKPRRNRGNRVMSQDVAKGSARNRRNRDPVVRRWLPVVSPRLHEGAAANGNQGCGAQVVAGNATVNAQTRLRRWRCDLGG